MIIRKQKIGVRDLVFGVKNQTPSLNVIIVFFGGTLHRLPAKSFTRILLMSYVLYSLVVRNIYQGSLVHNLQSEDRKPTMSSINEMVENNFYFVMSATAVEHVQGHKQIMNRFLNSVYNSYLIN